MWFSCFRNSDALLWILVLVNRIWMHEFCNYLGVWWISLAIVTYVFDSNVTLVFLFAIKPRNTSLSGCSDSTVNLLSVMMLITFCASSICKHLIITDMSPTYLIRGFGLIFGNATSHWPASRLQREIQKWVICSHSSPLNLKHRHKRKFTSL